MQFQIATIFTVLIAAVAAMPSVDSTIQKRTCGELKGTELKVCQDACKALCTVGTAGLAATLCKSACTAGAL